MSLISEYAKRYDLMAHHGGSMDTDCQGSKFHSPTPLRVTPTYLSQVVAEAIGEPSPAEKPGEAVYWLCRTCEDNLAVFVRLLHATEGGLPWPVQREFGNTIRALGQEAWEHYKGATRG